MLAYGIKLAIVGKKKEEPEEDEYMKKLDKLQASVDELGLMVLELEERFDVQE
jgi:hypothetical protein